MPTDKKRTKSQAAASRTPPRPTATAGKRRRRAPAIELDMDWDEPLTMLGEARYSQSLERGLAILACFTPERPVLGIAELAEMLDMSRSTTHRYVITLVALGYLVQGRRRKYSLALRVTKLGLSSMSATSLGEHARPYIEELNRRSGFAVALAVLDGREIEYVEHVRARRRGRSPGDVGVAAGARLPVHCTATGKLLLAGLPADAQRAILTELKLARHGPRTITNRSALRSELQQIGEHGLASGHEELAPGLLAIAAPVRNECRETVAAVSMAAQSATIGLDDFVGYLGPHLISTADRISARLGYRRDDERVG